jgi:hypothetical protein
MRILKYELTEAYKQTIILPKDAKVLDVQMQRGKPTMWALVDERNPSEQRSFVLHATGAQLPPLLGTYVATFQDFSKGLVWHVFEV